jgi:hypothetical protein
LDRRLGGLQSRSGCGGKDKYSQSLPGLEPPIIQLIAQRCTTDLSRFLHVCFTKHYYSEQVKEGEEGGACSTHGKDEKFIQNFIEKPEGKRPLGRLRGR